MALSLLACTLKCEKINNNNFLRVILPVEHAQNMAQVYSRVHKDAKLCTEYSTKCSTTLEDDGKFEVASDIIFGDLKSVGEIRALHFHCVKEQDEEPPVKSSSSAAAVLNAFNLLMDGEKVHVKQKATCRNRKDELYNDVVDLMIQRDLKMHRSSLADEGEYIVQVITNALWCLTNHHLTINDAAKTSSDAVPVPELFEKFQGYNDFRRKKLKSQPLDQTQCDSHANALISILTRPIFLSDVHWLQFKEDIESLAKCLVGYKLYLENKLEDQKLRQSQLNPPRTVFNDISVEFRAKSPFVYEKYKLFDLQVKGSDYLKPILFDESVHLASPFENRMQKKRFFDNLRLSVDVDLFRYCPGGSTSTIMFVAKVPENRSANESDIQPVRVVAQIHNKLPEYHTRAMKMEFRHKMNLISKIQPGILDFIYKELALDASVASNPEMQQRIKMISLGETGLVADLRELNTGRPSNKFDVFFEKLEEVVENVTAADERRHGVAHLSHWISINDLINQAVERCPEETLVPSKSLVRLQFTPRNPYTHAALNFTSRIPVQYKIQKRQLRVQHPDQHYCAAQFKYFKSKAIELGPDAIMMCCDDKAKVPVGDPGVLVSTGVRGKKTLTPVSETLAAMDHDMTKSSLCPSVYLDCEIPPDIEKSFVRGQVHVVVNDSVFQSSNPFRHAAIVCNILAERDLLPKVLLRFSDGGTDQRNTLESVKCAAICIFKEMNLDMLILGRCAPGHSWVNPAERVMSILNLGLQNCALERADDQGKFKSCNSMSQIREHTEKKPELKPLWKSSIGPVQKQVEERFQRLKLKDVPFRTLDPASDESISLLQRHLRELFPEMDLTKLQKNHTKMVASYQSYLEKHCRQRHYTFQIRKCDDEGCCIPPTVDRQKLTWLPDPILVGQHYKPYSEVKDQDTTEEDRPTYQKVESVESKKTPKRTGNLRSAPLAVKTTDEPTHHDASIFTAQNARSITECCECRKPRVIYSKHKLTERQMVQVSLQLSEFDYTCGSFITTPMNKLHGIIFMRTQLSCSDTIELAYYSSEAARKDLCCFCATPDAEVSAELKKQYKTVLPICQECVGAGRKPICQRPYKTGPDKH